MKLLFLIPLSIIATVVSTFIITLTIHFSVIFIFSKVPLLDKINIAGSASSNIVPGAFITLFTYLIIAYLIAYLFHTHEYTAVGVTIATTSTVLAIVVYGISASLYWL